MNNLLFKDLKASTTAHVLTLTLNRPEKRNALSARLVNELIIAFEDAATDDDVRVIVLTGAGGAFCAGADLSSFGGSDEDSDLPHRGGFPELNLAMAAVHKPIIARVERYAMAGALALICGSTFVIAEDTARFGAPEIDRGIFPMMVLASLFRTISKRDGLDMVLTGRKIDAEEAVRMGLINQAVPTETLDETVAKLASTLANKPPTAVKMGLQAYQEQETLAFEDALNMLQERLMEVIGTEDAQEGILAFLQKRDPKWKVR